MPRCPHIWSELFLADAPPEIPRKNEFGYSLGREKEIEAMETWKLWSIIFMSLVGFWVLATWLT
jgi:hypothetical protein